MEEIPPSDAAASAREVEPYSGIIMSTLFACEFLVALSRTVRGKRAGK